MPGAQPAAVEQLDMHPVNQQRSCAQLAHPAPPVRRVLGPKECKSQEQQDNAHLDQNHERAVEPEFRLCIRRRQIRQLL